MNLPPETIETTLKVYLRQMRARLDEAASILGRARSTPTCPSWTRNGLGVVATVQNFGGACEYKASKVPCVWSANGPLDDDGPRKRPTGNCKKCPPRGPSHD